MDSNLSIMSSRIVFSPIGINGFGITFVKGRSLVPLPPAIIRTGTSKAGLTNCP